MFAKRKIGLVVGCAIGLLAGQVAYAQRLSGSVKIDGSSDGRAD